MACVSDGEPKGVASAALQVTKESEPANTGTDVTHFVQNVPIEDLCSTGILPYPRELTKKCWQSGRSRQVSLLAMKLPCESVSKSSTKRCWC